MTKCNSIHILSKMLKVMVLEELHLYLGKSLASIWRTNASPRGRGPGVLNGLVPIKGHELIDHMHNPLFFLKRVTAYEGFRNYLII